MATDATSSQGTDAGGTALTGGDGASTGAAGAGSSSAAGSTGNAAADAAAKALAEKTAADATAAKGAEESIAPEVKDLEIKLPEGWKADDNLGKFKEIAKTHGLKPEAAQKIVDFYVETQKAQAAELDKLRASWSEQLKQDKELGPKLQENVQVARKAMAKFASPELTAYLKATGLGNHPEFVRLLNRVGKALAEDSISGATGGSSAPSATGEEAFHRTLYPSMFKE